MSSMVEGGGPETQRLRMRLAPSTTAFGDGHPPRTGEELENR